MVRKPLRLRSCLLVILLAGLSAGCGPSGPAPLVQGTTASRGRLPGEPSAEMSLDMSVHTMSTPFILPGVQQPNVEPPEVAQLADDDEVIGISANGQDRAYLIRRMSSTRSHVVNDMFGDQPVTVTYCNRTDCIRVLTDAAQGEPLKIELGGWIKGKLALLIASDFLPQDSHKVPFQDLPFQRMTWKEWYASHPQTDVYTGRPAPEPTAEEADESDEADEAAEADLSDS
ncbi:MAG: DUF3179 domain-containing (seleno)protein [Planctomycetales bacterium]